MRGAEMQILRFALDDMRVLLRLLVSMSENPDTGHPYCCAGTISGPHGGGGEISGKVGDTYARSLPTNPASRRESGGDLAVRRSCRGGDLPSSSLCTQAAIKRI